MSSEENQISSDDEDLPDLDGNSGTSEQKFEIAQNDIVWAEFRNLYWPALVRCVKKKERKASIWYLDSPKKCFKVPFKKIKSFSDPQMTALVKNEVENSPMKAKHKRVWLNAITYIRRKTQGYNDDPASYFDLNYHYLAYKDKDFDTHCSSEIENSEVTLKPENGDQTSNTENSDPMSSDEESLVSDDEEESLISKKLSTFTNLDEKDGPEGDNIVKCIAAGYVDKHLLQIKSKKVSSNYQELYEVAMKTDRKKLMYITPTDHVKSNDNLKKIAIYLMNYYEKVVEGGKCEMVEYILYVWLPEAINKAVELISNGSFNVNMTISDSRRKLFPTDELVNGKIYDPIKLIESDSVDKPKSKKRGRPKVSTKKQPKKVKICDSSTESKLIAKASISGGSKSALKSPEKTKNPNVKSHNKKESAQTKSLNKIDKTSIKSPTTTLRSLPRKKV